MGHYMAPTSKYHIIYTNDRSYSNNQVNFVLILDILKSGNPTLLLRDILQEMGMRWKAITFFILIWTTLQILQVGV